MQYPHHEKSLEQLEEQQMALARKIFADSTEEFLVSMLNDFPAENVDDNVHRRERLDDCTNDYALTRNVFLDDKGNTGDTGSAVALTELQVMAPTGSEDAARLDDVLERGGAGSIRVTLSGVKYAVQVDRINGEFQYAKQKDMSDAAVILDPDSKSDATDKTFLQILAGSDIAFNARQKIALAVFMGAFRFHVSKKLNPTSEKLQTSLLLAPFPNGDVPDDLAHLTMNMGSLAVVTNVPLARAFQEIVKQQKQVFVGDTCILTSEFRQILQEQLNQLRQSRHPDMEEKKSVEPVVQVAAARDPEAAMAAEQQEAELVVGRTPDRIAVEAAGVYKKNFADYQALSKEYEEFKKRFSGSDDATKIRQELTNFHNAITSLEAVLNSPKEDPFTMSAARVRTDKIKMARTKVEDIKLGANLVQKAIGKAIGTQLDDAKKLKDALKTEVASLNERIAEEVSVGKGISDSTRQFQTDAITSLYTLSEAIKKGDVQEAQQAMPAAAAVLEAIQQKLEETKEEAAALIVVTKDFIVRTTEIKLPDDGVLKKLNAKLAKSVGELRELLGSSSHDVQTLNEIMSDIKMHRAALSHYIEAIVPQPVAEAKVAEQPSRLRRLSQGVSKMFYLQPSAAPALTASPVAEVKAEAVSSVPLVEATSVAEVTGKEAPARPAEKPRLFASVIGMFGKSKEEAVAAARAAQQNPTFASAALPSLAEDGGKRQQRKSDGKICCSRG